MVGKAIGVSNHSVPFLTKLLEETTIVPAVNQIENHPLLPQDDVVALCKEKGIVVTAYSPLGSAGGPLLKEEKVLKVAEKHGVAVGTVLLNYHGMRIPSFFLGVFSACSADGMCTSQPWYRRVGEIGYSVKD